MDEAERKKWFWLFCGVYRFWVVRKKLRFRIYTTAKQGKSLVQGIEKIKRGAKYQEGKLETMELKKENRGGARKNDGRKQKEDGAKAVTVSLNIRTALYQTITANITNQLKKQIFTVVWVM